MQQSETISNNDNELNGVADTIKIEMPKTYTERLDELNIGESILVEGDDERKKFNSVMYRSFHKDGIKKFTIRNNKKTNEVRVFRLE